MILRALILLIFTLQYPVFSQTQLFNGGKVKEGDHHTSVQLLADVRSIQPGMPFTAGILMKMDEGWHTYWKNSGEAGLPTTVEWSLPAGFRAGEIQWPLPHKYNESGDILTYGYATENMLLVTVTPPADLKAGSTVTLKAKVDWLECEKLCVPGDAAVEVKLPVEKTSPGKAHEALFAAYRSQVPPALPPDLSLATQTTKGMVEVRVETPPGREFVVAPGTVPDLYPESAGDLTFGRTEVQADARRATMRVPLSAYEKVAGPLTFRGVVVYKLNGGARQAATIEIPLSREFCSSIPVEGETSESASQSSGSILDRQFTAIEAERSQQPLVLYVLFAILGGLLLNIMPCVLPVIALKIFGLVKMAGDQPRRVRKLGWFFSLGILVSFLSLAVLVIGIKAAGESVGWGFQFQEPLFVIIMAAIVFAFGLSLFGVFEIRVPGFAVAGVSKVATQTHEREKGFLVPFAEGIFATILATPCTAPFLGSAMGFAFAEPPYIIVLLFACVAFGMALPYLILTAKPAWMKFLPKPGEWMEIAKQFMGFLMMGTAVWLLYILGKQLGMEAVIWAMAFLLFVGLACWVIGRFATLTATRAKYVGAWVAALLLVLAGYRFFIGDVMKAGEIVSGPVATVANSGKLAWQPFSVEGLESHLRENKTVFIDFTAEWCLTCKVNEKTVLADQEVIDRMKEKGIVTMKADWTNRNETITRLLQKFGRSGVPLYVMFPAGKPTEPIVLPEVITTGIVLKAISDATGV